MWDTEAPGIWTDSFTDHGLATAAGWIDSTALGAHGAIDNNGFDRTTTVIPTTDVKRMVTFFEGELERRGVKRSDFEDASPLGGPIYNQLVFTPSECKNGEGISKDGAITWLDLDARYVYVLEADADSPSVPPNLDRPDGTIWRLDVAPSRDAIPPGLLYGTTPPGTRQAEPENEAAPELEVGKSYYLYVLLDIGVPVTRCVFTYPTDGEEKEEPSPEEEIEDKPQVVSNNGGEGWNKGCTTNADCSDGTDFCAKQPGETDGYCTIHCTSTSVCLDSGSPAEWTCNALSCEVEDFTWCGPPSEIEEAGGILKECK